MKKRTISAIAIIFILMAGTAYALLSGYFETDHSLTIAGVGVTAFHWIDDITTPTEPLTTYDWGTLGQSSSKDLEYIVLLNEGTIETLLEFTDNLNPAEAEVAWYIEFYTIGGGGSWSWVNWQTVIDAGTPYGNDGTKDYYVPGTPENPFEPGEYVGMRPTLTHLCLGRIKLTVTTTPTVPIGTSVSFTTIVHASEIA